MAALSFSPLSIAVQQSATDRIPPEILSHIFLLGSTCVSFGESTPFPLLVSQVCGRWRDIALGNSRLWTTISCTRDTPRYPILKILLERSRSQPLDLHFDFTFSKGYLETYPSPLPRSSDPEHPFVNEEYESPFHLTDIDKISRRIDLLTTSLPLRTYSVTSNNYSYISLSIRSFPLGPAPHLIDFAISYIPGYEDISRCGTIHVPLNGVAPGLKSLSLRGVDMYWAASTFITGLTYLELRDHDNGIWMSYPKLQAILASNSSLETLVLDNSGSMGVADEWRVEEVLELPHLTRLVFARQRAREGAAILRRLWLPGLKRLEVDLPVMGEERVEETHDEILRLFVPLVERLEILRIEEIHCSEGAVRSLLAALTSLRVFVLNFTKSSSGDSNPSSSPSIPPAFIALLSHCTTSGSPSIPLYVPHLSFLIPISGKPEHIHTLHKCRSSSLFNVYAPTVSTSGLRLASLSLDRVGDFEVGKAGEDRSRDSLCEVELTRRRSVQGGASGLVEFTVLPTDELLSRIGYE